MTDEQAPQPTAEPAFDADVAVIGVGAIGSSAVWQLAERGLSVIGIEQFEPGHDQGGSHGVTRLFRVACLEHPGLTPIARRARDRWRELEAASGRELLYETGGLMVGPAGSRIIEGTLAAARAHDLPIEQLTADDVRARFPGHAALTDDEVGVWDPEAGVLRPEAAIVAAADAAVAAGATILTGTRVQSIDEDADGVTVTLPEQTLRVRTVVVAAGPWIGRFAPNVPLVPHRVVLTWFRAREGESAELATLPVFIRSIPRTDEWVWGHGASAEWGFDVKVGTEFEGPGPEVDPNEVDRVIHDGENAEVIAAVAATFPVLAPEVVEATTCIMAHTPDGQFLVGPAPGSDRVILAGGCSGHSFKHAAALGEIAAQLAAGEAPFTDIGFLDPRRFARA